MGRGFIELHDDYGFRYLVNIDKIVNVSVDNKRVWTGEKSSLYICGERPASLGRAVAKLADSWNSR